MVDAFDIAQEQLPGTGLAYLTASSTEEDAQESDALQGSFFTQALVTGLLGAADNNRDGAVALEEAYHYAYEATLRATSLSVAGVQHPTFRYDLSGRGALILTRPAAYSGQRGRVQLPPGLGVIIMREDENGPVVAEVPADSSSRTMSLPPGRYFVRVRGEEVVYEGSHAAVAGALTTLDVDALRRIEYVQLVRKGSYAQQPLAQRIEVGALAHRAAQ